MLDQLDGFRLWLVRQGKAESTIATKTDLMTRLLANVSPLSKKGVESYLFNLYQNGKSASYLNTFIDALRLYQRSLKQKEWDIPYFKEKETFKTLLTNEEIRRLLECSPPRGGEKESASWCVWTMFFKICAFTGMRPGEVAKLTTNDIQEDTIIIRESKTGEFRVVPISPKLKDDLYNYIRGLNSEYLFPSKRGDGVVGDVDWGYNFHTRCKRAGINKKGISVYSLRFSFITRLLSDDVNLFKVQRMVGHRRVDQTAHYTRYVVADLQKAIEHDSLAKDGITQERVISWIIRFIDKMLERDKRFKKTIIQKPHKLKIEISF